MKRPAMQVYVADWGSNKNLKRCTHAEKGIWLEVMFIMHDSEEYGMLRWPLEEIANAVGCKVSDLESLHRKGVLKGADTDQPCEEFIYTPRHAGIDGAPVVLIEEQSGPLWYSSRMVKDEYVRQNRGKGTRFGDEPKVKPNSSPTQRIGEAIIIPEPKPIQRIGDGPSITTTTSKKESLSPLPPTLSTNGNSQAKKPEINLNDFFIVYDVVCRLLGVQQLGKPDQEILSGWCVAYDMRGYALPIIERRLQKFRTHNDGKNPVSLAYFNPELEKKADAMARAAPLAQQQTTTPESQENKTH